MIILSVAKKEVDILEDCFINNAANGTPDNSYDDYLVRAAAESAEAYSELIMRYLPSIRVLAGVYTRSAADRDDLVSEGILGLMNAVKTYQSGKGAKFSTYAGVCINNRMRTALKKSTAISRREGPLVDAQDEVGESPENIFIEREALNEIFSEASQSFSELEKQVFAMRLGGCTYNTIAKRLDLDRKSVDNALARVRMKLRKKFR